MNDVPGSSTPPPAPEIVPEQQPGDAQMGRRLALSTISNYAGQLSPNIPGESVKAWQSILANSSQSYTFSGWVLAGPVHGHPGLMLAVVLTVAATLSPWRPGPLWLIACGAVAGGLGWV